MLCQTCSPQGHWSQICRFCLPKEEKDYIIFRWHANIIITMKTIGLVNKQILESYTCDKHQCCQLISIFRRMPWLETYKLDCFFFKYYISASPARNGMLLETSAGGRTLELPPEPQLCHKQGNQAEALTLPPPNNLEIHAIPSFRGKKIKGTAISALPF